MSSYRLFASTARTMLRPRPNAMATRTAVPRRFAHNTGEPRLQGSMDNEFNRERRNIKEHAGATSDLWRKLSIYVVIPALAIAGLNAWNLWNEHWEHWDHMAPLDERPEYPYQNIRSKNYPWGDGDKTLFWNTTVNYHKHDE